MSSEKNLKLGKKCVQKYYIYFFCYILRLDFEMHYLNDLKQKMLNAGFSFQHDIAIRV